MTSSIPGPRRVRPRAPNDVRIIASFNGQTIATEDMTIVTVNVPDSIRRKNTPVGMPDRIPPRVGTSFNVQVLPSLAGSGQSIRLEVRGQSDANGRVDFNGAPTATLDRTTTITLVGRTQTEPGGKNGGANGGTPVSELIMGNWEA